MCRAGLWQQLVEALGEERDRAGHCMASDPACSAFVSSLLTFCLLVTPESF